MPTTRDAILWLLAATAASGQLTRPRVEDGGWQPVLGKPVGKKGRAAESRQDIPAFYVWLPTELLDHIHPNGPNFAQIQPPAGFQRSRPNYLPALDVAARSLQAPRSAAYGPLQSEEDSDESTASKGSYVQFTGGKRRDSHPPVLKRPSAEALGCSPVRSAAVTSNRSLRQVADSLGAGRFLDRLGITETELFAGHDGAYTLFLPADDSVELVSPQLWDSWHSDRRSRQAALLNHVVPSRVALQEMIHGGSFPTRAGGRLNVRRNGNGVVTVNGQRVIAADNSGPRGGILHVISGPLSPTADRDVLTTLSDCAKYDGFLTLATGTGIADLLRRGERTLFLPSNDALSKVPPEELKVYQKNVTALKEFLTYHVVNGIYYSHDLRDGQYLKSMHNDLPIRVGINVDGCNRRLYEANNSPLYRADIPASNGVIHVVDWILLPGDHKWCTGLTLP